MTCIKKKKQKKKKKTKKKNGQTISVSLPGRIEIGPAFRQRNLLVLFISVAINLSVLCQPLSGNRQFMSVHVVSCLGANQQLALNQIIFCNLLITKQKQYTTKPYTVCKFKRHGHCPFHFLYVSAVEVTSRKHACIFLTPLNPTVI